MRVKLDGYKLQVGIKHTNVCYGFVNWFRGKFPTRETDLATVWEAMTTPAWMTWFLCDKRIQTYEMVHLGYRIDEAGGGENPGAIGFKWTAPYEDAAQCDLIRLAMPGELLEALMEGA